MPYKKPAVLNNIENHYIQLSDQSSSILPLDIQKNALAVFKTNGLPTLKHENWQYTSLNHLFQAQIIKASQNINYSTNQLAIDKTCKPIIISLIDNNIHGKLPKGLSVLFKPSDHSDSISVYNKQLLENHQDDSLLALNQLTCQNVVIIKVANNTLIEQPIIIDYGTDTDFDKSDKVTTTQYLNSTQVIVQIGTSSEATIIEYYRQTNEHSTLDLTSCVFDLAVNANCHHFSMQKRKESNQQFNYYHANLDQDSQLDSSSIIGDNLLTRRNFNSDLKGKGAQLEINSCYHGTRKQVLDTRTYVRHLAPNCDSQQLHQGLLNENSEGVFNGVIYVHPDALQTNGQMDNNVILLSDDSKNNSKPQLEIYADDVKCSHGFTCGAIDQNQLYYMRQRGIPKDLAQQQILKAFEARVTEKFPKYMLIE